MATLLAKNGDIIGGFPISADNFKLLWENPSPNSAFAAQNIDLSSDDYDFLLVEWTYGTGTIPKYVPSVIVPKGQSVQLNEATSTSNGVGAIYRNIDYVNDTRLLVGDCALKDMSNSAIVYNTLAIPVFIYGIKKDTYANVSTDASKCMLSDGVTSVGDVIDKGSVSVTADGVKTYAQLLNELYGLIDFEKLSYNSVFSLKATSSNSSYFQINSITNGVRFTRTSYITDSSAATNMVNIASSSTYKRATIGGSSTTFTDFSTSVPAAGEKLTVHY